jgi:hypothetical protein
MIEKNDPHHEKEKPDNSDNDLIIELTDEIETKSEDETASKIERQLQFDTDKLDMTSEQDDDVLTLDEKEDVFGADTAESESDEDELDFFTIDDENTEEDDDRLSLLEDLELKFDEEDDKAAPVMDGEKDSEPAEIVEFENTGDLPDLIAEMEFDLDEQEDVLLSDAIDKHKAEDGEIESLDDSEIINLDDAQHEGTEIEAPVQDELLDVETDEDLFNFDDDLNLESEDEVTLRNEADDIIDDDEEELIEITEFDQHYQDDDEKLLEHAGVLDTSDSEDEDYLELLDVDEENRFEDQEILVSSVHENEATEADNGAVKSDALTAESGMEDDTAKHLEDSDALDSDLAMTAAALASGAEKLDLDTASAETSPGGDQLDTFLGEDSNAKPKLVVLSEDQPKEEATAEEDQQKIPDETEPLPVSPELITAAVENVINEKFAGKIENIIYEIIEKAVTREIDRLKEALFENSASDSNR